MSRSTPQPIIAEAINYYHSLLNGTLADDAREHLQVGRLLYHLSFGERPICSVLRPFFVTARQYEYVRRESTLVLSAIEKLARALLNEPRLRAELDLSADEEQLIQIEPGYPAPDASGRLDAFLDSRRTYSYCRAVTKSGRRTLQIGRSPKLSW